MNHRLGLSAPLLAATVLLAACTGGPTPQRPGPTAASAAPEAPAAAAPAAAAPAPAAPNRPDLPTTPAVKLTVGAGVSGSYAPLFVAQARGHFKEQGLEVELSPSGNVYDHLPALAQGQMQVGSCSNNVGCFNALARGVDLKIVADLSSTGRTPRSTGSTALVVRKDLWDSGAIRDARDLLGRQVYMVAGQGSGHYALVARWLRAQGLDPHAIDWPLMVLPDQFAAMQNRGIEVGVQTEPLLTAGVLRDIHRVMVTGEEMNPNAVILYLMYWSGIDRLGPRVGERFMVAYLRGVRDYLNAFEYGVDQDAIIQVLTQETVLKDPAVYRQIKYGWVDPNGAFATAALQADADQFHELGLTAPIDLSPMFDDRYRQLAVEYLGEYRPPQTTQ